MSSTTSSGGQAGVLTPDQAGVLHGAQLPATPLSSARWQGVLTNHGVDGLSVWGAGKVGRLLFQPPLSDVTAVEILPNEVRCRHSTGSMTVSVHPELPVLQISFTGVAPLLRLAPPRKPQDGFTSAGQLERTETGWRYRAPWAHCEISGFNADVLPGGRLQPSPDGTASLVLAASHHELQAAKATLARGQANAEFQDAALAKYQQRVIGTFTSEDPLLTSMFAACLGAALGSRKTDTQGNFAGLAAGTHYSAPARTYYRDSYWTAQVLLPLEPELVQAQLLLLARGIDEQGRAPSAVITADEAGLQIWQAQKAASAALRADHHGPREWWSDHMDSPLYFAILAAEVARWTGNPELAEQQVDGRSLGQIVTSVLDNQPLGSGALPLKPDHDRDWADNVFRSGRVTYNGGLYHGALMAGEWLFKESDPARAQEYAQMAKRARTEAAKTLVTPGGWLTEADTVQPALSLDSLTAVRFGLVNSRTAAATLDAMRRLVESNNNAGQPYGDWGPMCRWPLYEPQVRRRAKSAFPYRYHNGSVWPYLAGLYAETVMQHGRPNWRYGLVRWWEYSLQQGWPAPVEYYSPPWGRGSLVNGWGAMPAAAMLFGGLGLRPKGDPTSLTHGAPWGPSRVAGVRVNGRVSTLSTTATKVEVDSGE